MFKGLHCQGFRGLSLGPSSISSLEAAARGEVVPGLPGWYSPHWRPLAVLEFTRTSYGVSRDASKSLCATNKSGSCADAKKWLKRRGSLWGLGSEAQSTHKSDAAGSDEHEPHVPRYHNKGNCSGRLQLPMHPWSCHFGTTVSVLRTSYQQCTARTGLRLLYQSGRTRTRTVGLRSRVTPRGPYLPLGVLGTDYCAPKGPRRRTMDRHMSQRTSAATCHVSYLTSTIIRLHTFRGSQGAQYRSRARIPGPLAAPTSRACPASQSSDETMDDHGMSGGQILDGSSRSALISDSTRPFPHAWYPAAASSVRMLERGARSCR